MWAAILVHPPKGDPYVVTLSVNSKHHADLMCKEIAEREQDVQRRHTPKVAAAP